MTATDTTTEPVPTPAQAVWQALGFCECGSPTEVMGLFKQVLEALALRQTGRDWSEEANPELAALVPLNDPRALLIHYVLDKAGLTEHGGAVYGCWPTDEGKALLAYLQATPEEDWFPDPY